MRPLVIGSKKRLSITSRLQGSEQYYYEVMRSSDNVYIGEDVYRLSPMSIKFSQNKNSSPLFLGDDKSIASSLCTSVVLSLLKRRNTVHLFNADRTKIQDEDESFEHPFMYVCRNMPTEYQWVKKHNLNQLDIVLKSLYSELRDRKKAVQDADDSEDPRFEPIFLIINDLFGIDSFRKNSEIKITDDNIEEFTDDTINRDLDLLSVPFSSSDLEEQIRIGVQDVMSDLLKDGYRYNIHLILSIRGDTSVWRNYQLLSDAGSIVFFNHTDYADQIDNAYYLKEMLKNISNESDKETLAVWYQKKRPSKLRPLIYDMSDKRERELIDIFLKGEN